METEPRVIHIDTERGWRGGQRQAAWLAEGLIRAGVQSLMVTAPGTPMADYCARNAIPVEVMKTHGELDFISGYRTAELASKRGFNIIHAHAAHAHTTALWARCFRRELKVVGARRVDFPPGRSLFSRFKYTTPLLDRTICISKAIERVMEEAGIPGEKLTVIHSGIDLNETQKTPEYSGFRKEFAIPRDHLVVGTVAAMVPHKDYGNLLRAAKKVLKTNPGVTFFALGKGEQRNEILNLARELGVMDSFRFPGFRSEAVAMMRCFDIFVMPSREEGLGTSILDASALGLPVVGTDAGGIPEAVRNMENGLLVERENSDGLADAILLLLENRELRDTLGRNGLETVKEFSVKRTVEKTMDLYEGLLRGE